MIKALFLTLVLGTGYYQVQHDGRNRVHEVYRSRHDVVLGEYVQLSKGYPFLAWCEGGDASFVATEKEARRVVEACR